MKHSALKTFVPVLLLGASLAGAGQAQTFHDPHPGTCTLKFKSSSISTGTNPQTVVVADFNKDGKADFAEVNYSGGGAGSVGVFLGNGDGTFTSKGKFAVGLGPDGIAAADVNGDGKLDLVTADDTGSRVSVLLGDGDGTFQTHTDYTTGGFPHSVALGDFNGDGAPDIAVANEGDDTVGVLLNNGKGSFGAMKTYATGSEPYWVTAADLRHNGKTDMVVAQYNAATVGVFLGNGDGTFRTRADYATGTAPAVVLASDLNGDRKLDLATANYNNGQTGSVSVLLGNGDGTFLTHTDYTAGTGPDGLAVGRFEGNRTYDLAVADLIGNTMSILPGNGDGTFGAPQNFATQEYPLGIGAGVFKGRNKRKQDLIVTNDLSAAATLFLNKTRHCE
ncbi:MAG: FG-GAP repeat domain-containing protein [Rhizomicrobium sp.]